LWCMSSDHHFAMSVNDPYFHSIQQKQQSQQQESSSHQSRRNSWSSDVGVAHDDVFSHYDSENTSFPEDTLGDGVELRHIVTPDGTNSAQEFFYDEDEEELFEPYHDPETNRIIMRMRMGSLMDDEEGGETEIINTDVVQDQSPAWTLFDNRAFDRFSFFQKNKHQQKEDGETPIDQVSYTDPYNAWDSLPTFLQSPYSLISTSKKQDNKQGNKQSDSIAKTKRKMKETRINKQGFLEEYTITTTSSSSTTSLIHHNATPTTSIRNIAVHRQSVSDEKNQQELQEQQPEPRALEDRMADNIGETDDAELSSIQVSESSVQVSPHERPPFERQEGHHLPVASERLSLSFDLSQEQGQRDEQENVFKDKRKEALTYKSQEPSVAIESSPARQAPQSSPASASTIDSDHTVTIDQSSYVHQFTDEQAPLLEYKKKEALTYKSQVPSVTIELSPERQTPLSSTVSASTVDSDHTVTIDQSSSVQQSTDEQAQVFEDKRKEALTYKSQERSVTIESSPGRQAPQSSPASASMVDSDYTVTIDQASSQASSLLQATAVATEGETRSPNGSIETVLEMYKSMIQNKSVTSIHEIRQAMEQELLLSEREIAAFLYGLELTLSQAQATPRSLLLKLPERRQGKKKVVVKSSSSEAGTTTSNNSFSSQRMKARASIRSTGFDESMSNLMASMKKEHVIPRRRVRGDDDVKTAISVMSTLSCRELSIQRLRRRMTTSRKNEQREVEKLLQELQEAQTRQKRLEQQLNKAGISIAQDIPYAEAKAQVSIIAEQMQAIGHSQATHPDPKVQAKMRQEYFVLEQNMEKYMRALELTDEYLQEQQRLENAFDNDNLEENERALAQIWNHMPINIRQKSVDEWLETRSPSGKSIPKPFLLKFSRTNILTLLRMNPDFIQRAHPCNLEQRRVTGLTLTERRALQAFLYPIASKWRNAKDSLTKRKWNWYCILRQTLKDHLLSYQHHASQHGLSPDGSCSCGGIKCPVKADQKLDYFQDDYGYPSSTSYPEYETACYPASSPQKRVSQAPARPSSSTRNSLLSELSAPKKGKISQKTQPKSSLMEELVAARASMRKNVE
jgi:hypothetical protein